MSSELKEFKNFANHLAEISSEIIRTYFRTKVNVESKADSSPVTIADKKAEELMRESIMKQFPEHGILGEEFGNYNEDAEYKWVLDPIDGTKSFICGAVTFGTLIALMKNGEPLIGTFNQPILKEYLVGDNEITELNGSVVRVRECSKLNETVLLTTDHLNIGKYHNQNKFDELIRKVKLYRQWGDCYGYYLVATGFADVMIDPIMSPWDSLALIPIIRGAKGAITDYSGNDPVKGKSIVASTPGIHDQIISLLNN
jgi:histidinol-phosphatase